MTEQSGRLAIAGQSSRHRGGFALSDDLGDGEAHRRFEPDLPTQDFPAADEGGGSGPVPARAVRKPFRGQGTYAEKTQRQGCKLTLVSSNLSLFIQPEQY